MDSATFRILDANLNRAREGLRVLEEYARFVLNDAIASTSIKRARHALAAAANGIDYSGRLLGRNTPGDVGTKITTETESSRRTTESVARAATARVAEALRCIEEYGKLVDVEVAGRIEQLRYDVYSIEQDLFAVSPRRQRLRQAKLHVLMTESLCAAPWLDTATAVLQAGADVIQLREKSLGDAELLRRARQLRTLTDSFDALLVINDRPDIARLANADAVHLGQEDLPADEARRIAGPTILIGGSAHDQPEIASMLAAGVDYLGVGPMFASGTKPDVDVRGPDLLTLASRLITESADCGGNASESTASNLVGSASTPLVAIGGITASNVAALSLPAGTSFAIAVCGGIIGNNEPAAATRRLLAAMNADQDAPDHRS